MNEVDYERSQETVAIGKFLKELEDAVRKQNDGRNLRCWPVLSFGWKDADLEPEGCTGIKSLGWKDETTVLVEVGGHKTFAYDSDNSDEKREADWLYLCSACAGYSCDGDAEEFTASFSDTLQVAVSFTKKKRNVSIPATVKSIINAAQCACEEFEKDMADVSEGLQ